LNLDCAAHSVDDTAELDNAAIAGPLDDTTVVGGDGGVDEIAAQAPKSRKGPVLIDAGEPAISDDVSD
jgi:hypothetical protein